MKFESLIDLISHYQKFSLYPKVKLSYPVSKDIVKRMGNLSLLENDNQYASDFGYMDPSSVARDKVTVKALYDYKAQHDDELSFCKHAIITNVDKKNNQLWWTGDYGGKLQQYFPANYVIELNSLENFDGNENSDPLLGNSQKGSIDISGAVVELAVVPGGEAEWMIRIHTPTMQNYFEIGSTTKELAVEWRNAIVESAQSATVQENERRKIERDSKVAKEMSDLIIYCRSVPFKNAGWLFYEMSSFAETKAEKYFLQQEMRVSKQADNSWPHNTKTSSLSSSLVPVVPQVPSQPNQSRLPEGPAPRLVELPADSLLEHWLADDRAELPNARQADADFNGQVSRQRWLRLCSEARLYVER
jgi:phosphatidylinositol phospholipase C, gamma-1